MGIEEYLSEFDERDWQTTTDGTVRFALIGLGWWTVEHAIPAIADSEFCVTTVLVTSSTKKADQVAADVDVDTIVDTITYDDFHDGEATSSYDAVYICTPNALHLEYVETAAALGKHVLVEKPMEATVDRARELVTVCDAHGVTLAVGYRMHTEPVVRHVRDAIASGAIGTPRYVHSANTQRLLDIIPDNDQWRLDPKLSGYGTSVMDLGIYSINTARFILDADPVAAQAMMHSDHPAFDAVPDEHAVFTLEFENGVYATCSASQNARFGSFIEVIGTDGRIRIEPAFQTESEFCLTIGEHTVDFDTPSANQMTEVFDYVAHGLLTDDSLSLDGEHGIVDMQTIQTIHRAASTTQRVKIDQS